MSTLRRRSRGAWIWFLLCAAGAGAGCGRMLIGQEAVGLPDAGGRGGADASAADTSPPGKDSPTAPPDLPQVCTAAGWCWTHPLPTSDRFVNAFAVGADDLWFIGASGSIVRFAGGAWSAIPSPTDALATIWASASDDVWVGGAAGPYHWNGRAWTQVPPPTSPDARAVNAIWGCAPDDVWIMGTVATHWDGRTLSFVDMGLDTGVFRTVWGSACNDVWAGSLRDSLGSGRIAHWNGSAWMVTENRPGEQVAGTGADDVWSLAQGQLFHWSGLGAGALRDSHTLNLFPLGDTAVGTMSDTHLISVFARGGAMALPAPAPAPAPDGVTALWGRSASDLWGLGARGLATHRGDSAAWTAHLPGWALSGDDAARITGSGPSDLWAVVGNTLLRGDGSTWSTALTPQQVGGRIYDLWARAANDVWVLGGDALIHRWNGAAWKTEDPTPRGSTTPEMRAISGTGPDDVWILRGRNSVLHWDGATWISRQPMVDNLVDLWAPGPNEVWVVGDSVSHWRGTGWSPPRIPFAIGNAPFTAVGGSGPADVWILAGGYALQVSDDYVDLNVALSSSWRAAALAPAGGGGVWVLFQEGTTASRLFHLTGPAPGGSGTTLLAPAGFNDLWAAPDGTLWAAGAGGALMRKRPAP